MSQEEYLKGVWGNMTGDPTSWDYQQGLKAFRRSQGIDDDPLPDYHADQPSFPDLGGVDVPIQSAPVEVRQLTAAEVAKIRRDQHLSRIGWLFIGLALLGVAVGYVTADLWPAPWNYGAGVATPIAAGLVLHVLGRLLGRKAGDPVRILTVTALVGGGVYGAHLLLDHYWPLAPWLHWTAAVAAGVVLYRHLLGLSATWTAYLADLRN